MMLVDWLAIDRAWTPSCCLVCRACRVALSEAMSASTRFEMPVCREVCSDCTKVRWLDRALEPVPSLVRAVFTLVRSVSSVPMKALAAVAVANEAVADRVTLAPPSDRSSAWTVSLAEPLSLASA